MDAAVLATLRLAGPAVLLVAMWAVWQRRLTFGSPLDAPITVSVVLFGVGAAVDVPSAVLASASYPLTGKYYLVTVIGHLCYLAGAGLGISAVYARLLPDELAARFVSTVVRPIVIGAAIVMLVAFAASPVTSKPPADHLYLVGPDGWLTVYWAAHFGAATVLGVIASYGVTRLRADTRSVRLTLMAGSLGAGALFGGVIGGLAVMTGHVNGPFMIAWLLTFLAFVGGSVATALQWRQRVRALAGS